MAPFQSLKPNAFYPIGSKGGSYQRMQEIKNYEKVDVLFVGSSHAFRGFDVRYFDEHGIRSFNLGSPSQTPIQTKILLEHYLDKLDPEIVVYEVYPATFQNNGAESSIDLLANSDYHSGLIKSTFLVNDIRLYNTLLLDFMRQLTGLNTGITPVNNETDTYISGGYVESDLAFNTSPVSDKMKEQYKDQKWEFKNHQLKAFSELIELLRSRNTPVVLIQMPVTLEAYELYANNEGVDSLFTTFGSYLNLNGIISLDQQTDFIDYHHLSQSGVLKTNALLLDSLKYQLKD